MVTVIIILAALAVLFAVAVRGLIWPNGPCPYCKGRRGRGIGSTARAYNRCRRCGGSGERIRPLARLWPKHRETARKRRERLKGK